MELLSATLWSFSLQEELKKPWALFLDFDGTLVPITSRPEKAVLDSSTRDLLRSLSRWIPVVMVSGRALQDLRQRVNLRGLIYVGNHGLEIVGCGFRYNMENAIRWRLFLKKTAHHLKMDLGGIPGIHLEDKEYTLSVHYRLAGEKSRRRAAQLFSKHLRPFQVRDMIRISYGKEVWEVRPPVEWDKGHAVLWILKQPGFKKHWPLYIGDDETDQDVFRAIQARGIGIMVGPARGKGAAHYTIRGPGEVHNFLRWLLVQLCGKKALPLNSVS